MGCFTAAVVLVTLVTLAQGQISLLDILNGPSPSNTNQQGQGSSNQVQFQEQIITNLLNPSTGNQWTSNQLNGQSTSNKLSQQPTTGTQFKQQPTTMTQFNQQPATRTQFNQQPATRTQFNLGALGQPQPSPSAAAAAAAAAAPVAPANPDGFNQPVPPGLTPACTRPEKDTLFNRCAMSFGMSHMNRFDFLRSRRQCQVQVFQCPHVDTLVKCINSQPVADISNSCWLDMKNALTEFLHRYRLPCQFQDIYSKCKTESVTLTLISERKTAGSGMNNNALANFLPMIMRIAMPMLMFGFMGGQ